MSDQNSLYGNEGRQVSPLTPHQQAWVAVLQQLKSERELARNVARAENQSGNPTAIADEARLRVLQLEHAVNKHIDYVYGKIEGRGELHRYANARRSAIAKRYRAAGRVAPGDWKSDGEAWLIDLVAPFGGADEGVRDLKVNVLAGREVRIRGGAESGTS